MNFQSNREIGFRYFPNFWLVTINIHSLIKQLTKRGDDMTKNIDVRKHQNPLIKLYKQAPEKALVTDHAKTIS